MLADCTNLDIIPDIHADIDRLTRTLSYLGYRETSECWVHPEGRTAAFLGDLIDMGTQNAAVIALVRAMEQRGQAIAIMGNHELNALLYHARGENSEGTTDGYMRAHNNENTHQHRTFLNEFPVGAPQTAEVLDWFMTLPLFLDLPVLRLIHAYWDDVGVELVRRRRDDGRLRRSDLQELAFEKGGTGFARAVLLSLKGPEAELPTGLSFRDKNQRERTAVRLNWWETGERTWRAAALSIPDPKQLPDTPLPATEFMRFYDKDGKPVFFGHYKRSGQPALETSNALCLDYPGQPCAYRWDGETKLSSDRLIMIPIR